MRRIGMVVAVAMTFGCGHPDRSASCGWWSNDPACGASQAPPSGTAAAPLTSPVAPTVSPVAATPPVGAPASAPARPQDTRRATPSTKHAHGGHHGGTTRASSDEGGGSTSSDCKSDADCPPGRYCQSGACWLRDKKKLGNGKACEDDIDCESDNCEHDVCSSGSTMNRDLAPGVACSRNDECTSHDCTHGHCRDENANDVEDHDDD